jgi:hypothetical protein
MMDSLTTIDRLLLEIRESVSCSSRVNVLNIDETGFSIQLGQSAEAIVAVSLCDPDRPSFSASYPKLIADRHGHETIEEQISEGILSEGVSWIVRKVFRFGFVPPEGYRRPHINSGSAGGDASEDFDDERGVAPNHLLPRTLNSTSSVHGSENV